MRVVGKYPSLLLGHLLSLLLSSLHPSPAACCSACSPAGGCLRCSQRCHARWPCCVSVGRVCIVQVGASSSDGIMGWAVLTASQQSPARRHRPRLVSAGGMLGAAAHLVPETRLSQDLC